MPTREARQSGPAGCGHDVKAGHAVVRRGRRWVCTACSLPGGSQHQPPRCSCGEPLAPGQRLGLRMNGRWAHLHCVKDRPVALATVASGLTTWDGSTN